MRGACPYLLAAVDEYSCFPSVFLCNNMKSNAVVACLSSVFFVCGFLATFTATRAPYQSGDVGLDLR